MPLQSSGIIVVEKPTTATIATQQQQQQQQQQHLLQATATVQKSAPEIQYYEYYDANDVRQQQQQQHQQSQHAVVVDSNNGSQQQQQLVRRSSHQRTNSGSNSNSSTTTIQQFNIKHQQQMHHHQQQQQIIQHTTTHQAPQQQQQHVQQQAQQQSPHQQQVIQVSEEFIEQATAGNMMISTTGEVLNQQIFKIISSDGGNGNMILDSLGNTPNNSKVLLSNVTVLSKQAPSPGTTASNNMNASVAGQHHQQNQQQQPQTINFVSAKNLSYLTSTATSVSSATSTTSNGKQQKFSVAGTYKTGAKLQQQQQMTTTTTTYVPSSSPQHQQQQIVQKVTVPRNVQMVTRVQTLMQPTGGTTHQQQLQSPQQQQQTQMLVQQPQKYIASTSIGGSKTTSNMLKKSGTMKMSQSKLLNNLQQQQGVKTFIPQQHQQQTHYQTTTGGGSNSKVKSKLVKQYNNAISNSTGAVSIATLPQQQQQQSSLGTYTINHKANNHQQTTTTTKITKLSSNKYVMQNHQQQLQHVATLPQGTQLHHKTMHQNISNNSSIMLQQQMLNTSSSSGNSSAGTIKFVNAHGTVIQQHQTQAPMQQQEKLSTTLHRQQQPQHYQQQQQLHFLETSVGGDNNNSGSTSSSNIYQLPAASQQQSSVSPSQTSLLSDDIMIVNGTQMTDEISARILQSMAQKSFGNQQRYQQQKTNMPPPPQQIVVQHGASSGVGISAATSNILLSPKEYPLYSPMPQQSQQSTAQYVQQTTYLPIVSSATQSSATISSYSTTSSSSNSAASRPVHSAPGSRSQSMERKLHETSITRKSSEFFKVNTNEIVQSSRFYAPSSSSAFSLSPTSALIDIIPLPIYTINSNNNSSSSSSSSSNNINIMRSNSTSANSSAQSNAATPPEQTQVIHLQTMKTTQPVGNYANPNAATSNDDDIIGEEVRPVPVNTQDLRLQILHAVQQDHTYANTLPARLPSDVNAQQTIVGGSTIAVGSTLLSVGNSNSNRVGSSAPAVAQSPLGQSALVAGGQQWSLGGIGAVAVAAAGHSMATNSVAVGGSAAVVSPAILSNATQSSYTLYGQQIPRMQQDDDAHSAISNGSRVAMGDCDPGEETETAPEAEAEDDSVTRCICDLTHDDGYMICCDKCFAWQHVDCMGIDRQNIPDEYLCELCQPRAVDKVRARALQLMKRKEQQTQMLLTAQANAAGAMGTASGGVIGVGSTSLLPNDVLAQQRLSSSIGGGNFNLSGDASLQTLSAAALANNSLHPLKKGKVLKKTKDAGGSKKSKKAEKLAAGGVAGGLSGVGGKPPRKETKKSAKRKSKGGDGSSSGATAAEKYAANLRHWIEKYEQAVTNHYSPELRARLQAITKQPSLLQSILNTENRALKDCGSLENKSTTVPHAGGKILISNLMIGPNCPIVELRGKFMLTTQYKTQNTSINIPTSPNHNYPISYKAPHKVPGPFIFFYQLPGAEAPMQTMNPDGTYPPLPPQPAYLKGPEVCVDTRTYGNESRFVRRSCRPNAEIQHLFEKGTIHLFIVSLTDIRASTEITIRHEPHDLLALENKKSNNFMFQPTSTACGCGLTKDCLFPPPPPSAPTAAAKSSRNRPITLNGGALNSSAAMQLTMGGLPTTGATGGGKKKCPQNINRNRSTSSSGDSNMGLNSPNITQMNLNAACNSSNNSKSNNNNSNILSMAACSNMSNASSSMSSVMHDSGICTSSSSPSVSIPSPTSHIHSPTQQQQQQQHQQQQHQQQLLLPLTLPQPQPQQQPPCITVVQRTLIMQQSPQHQQILATLPTPMLPSPQLPQPQQQPQLVTQQPQQLQQIAVPQMPQPQPTLEVIAAAAAAQTPITVITPAAVMQHEADDEHQQPQQHPQQQPAIFMQMPQPQQLIPTPIEQQAIAEPIIIATNEDTLAAAALQSLNSSASSLPTTPIACEPQQLQQVIPLQQLQTPTEVAVCIPQQQVAAPQHTPQMVVASPIKSPQKNIVAATVAPSAPVPPNCGRKTPAKHARTTSVSEDVPGEHHLNDDGSSAAVAHTSTPKDKPKLSREDRKMEAILRAIEKMEKNQQRKQELKQSKSVSKRRNSNSNSPASPTKRGANSSADLDSSNPNTSAVASFSGMKKNPLSARKKKRKSHKSYNMHGTQRKRRKSRMNSNESDVDAAVTSESESTSMHSPPIQTTAGSSCSIVNTSATATIVDNCTAAAPAPVAEAVYSNDNDTANVDAGLLMAFANPKSPEEEHSPQKQSHSADLLTQHYAIEGLKSPQLLQSANEGTASPPPTPPAPVSSACLLIEAAVGPLEQFDSGSTQSTCGEFKYPGKNKPKKVLMSNWLHQSEVGDISANIMVTSPHNTSPNMSPMANTPPPNTTLSLGLESLVQAALSDYKQHGPNTDEAPQNLSMAAKKVEEFIYQTEGNIEPTQTPRPSYSQLRTNEQYNYKPPTVATLASVTRNLQLPLQVSTCSNNSSVKKRWLRQAISEETDENSMTPSSTPTTASPTAHHNAANPFTNVPNGFTTPLKKRRLVISSKDEEDNGHFASSSTPPLTNALDSPEMDTIKTEPEQVQGSSGNSSPMATDDVDVVGGLKCEEEAESEIVDVGHENISACHRSVTPPLEPTVIKHEAEPIETLETGPEVQHEDDIKSEMIMDQDDDVDILRSPSPGQQMVAEDNLVKIEPEDMSGGDDVKIDVEREESMAGDKFEEIMQVKKEEGTALSAVSVNEETKARKLSSEQTHPSTKIETVALKYDQPLVKAADVKSEGTSSLAVKKEEAAPKIESMVYFKHKLDIAINKSDEPVKKKPKLEPQTSLLKPLILKPVTQFALDSTPHCTSLLAAAAAAAAIALPPPPPPPHTTNTTAPHVSSTVATTATTTLIASSVVSTTSSSCTTATADSTSSTPPNRKNNERKNLSDDDIQERLLSFHKENILFLQSRNKKSKTGSGSSSSSSTPEGKSKSESKLAQSDAKTTATTTPQNKHKSSSGGISSSSKKSHKKDRNSSSSSSSKSSSKGKSSTVTCPSSATAGSSLSSKKLKALKKSSSSSSTSSSASNSNAIASSAATSSTSDKEKNRHRSTSTSSTSSTTSNSKKRQLNFEQELTKDMHLASIGKLRKESKDEASSSGTRKRRESSCGSRDENRTCSSSTNSSNKHKSSATSSSDKKPSELANKSTAPVATTSAVVAVVSTMVASSTAINAATITTTSASSTTPISEDKSPQQVQFSRVHPTIPHFNNIVTTPNHGLQTIKSLPAAFTVPPPPLRSNPPAQFNIAPPNMLKTLPVPIPCTHGAVSPGTSLNTLPPTAVAIAGTTTSTTTPPPPNSTAGANSLPYYNTIYGKLLDNTQPLLSQQQPPLQPQPSATTPSIVPPPSITLMGVQTAALPAAAPAPLPVPTAPSPTAAILSEYMDTKVKSFNTLGGYVSHTSFFGVNASITKPLPLPLTPATISSSSDLIETSTPAATPNTSSGSIEMPSPTTPPAIAGSKLPTPLKILTKTASHDPRLNPILTAPELPPAPKRKLSINEYRKRMQQSTDSSSSAPATPSTPDLGGSSALTAAATSTTSAFSMTSSSNSFSNAFNSVTSSSSPSPYAATINKCSLNSPERFDSGCAKDQLLDEKLLTDPLNSSSSLYASSNSSESMHKLNEENDSTKGQFSAAPTLLEKQQENLSERLKSLKSKQSAATLVAGRLTALGNDFGLKKETGLYLNRNSSASDLDHCLEAISSSSTSLASSRESSPERFGKKDGAIVNRHHHTEATLSMAHEKEAEARKSEGSNA